ncbi:MAG: peptide/nickel transport system permease protein [Rhodobacteraceae bacterium HLUCCA08]|nr:MAG: peptide/nickel transport system permease protein [Rhodobacteraceae bacterium HLUCCA08]
MSAWLWIIATLLAVAALGWVFRAGGRWVTGNAPRFRDMSYGEAFGFALAAAALAGGTWLYLQPGAVFFRWAVQGFVIFAVAAYLFRELGRLIGTEGTRKLFRQMPLTAAFGILVILVYSFVAIFAGQISLRTVIIVAVVGMILTEIVRRNTGDAAATGFGGLVFAVNLVFVVMYLVGPIAPHGQEQVFELANVVAGGDPALGGNPDFPLGTDQIGRDILSRLIFGAQNTVGIAFVTTLLAFFLGGTLGLLAATLGGWLDQLLSRGVDVLMAIPSLIFALLLMTIAAVWAPQTGIPLTYFMIVIIAVIDSTRVFRLARAVGINIVVMDYIEAAKLRGEGLGYLVFREILPNATAPLLAEFGLRFCFVFLTIAALSFLGVGIQPPLADWGTMVRDLAAFINYAQFAPMAAVTPLLAAGAIALLTVGVNFVVDWMLQKSSGLKE